MESWVRLGSEIYASDTVGEGALKIGGYTLVSLMLEMGDGAFGGDTLRFTGTEGTHPAPEGMVEGWLVFRDSAFPELKLTTVLRTKPGHTALRHVLSGEGTVSADTVVSLAGLLLPEMPKLYVPTPDGPVPVPAEEGLIPRQALVVETASGCLLLTGGDVFSLGTDENGACLCALQRLKEDVDLAQADFTSAWLELRLGATPAEVLAGTEWA